MSSLKPNGEKNTGGVSFSTGSVPQSTVAVADPTKNLGTIGFGEDAKKSGDTHGKERVPAATSGRTAFKESSKESDYSVFTALNTESKKMGASYQKKKTQIVTPVKKPEEEGTSSGSASVPQKRRATKRRCKRRMTNATKEKIYTFLKSVAHDPVRYVKVGTAVGKGEVNMQLLKDELLATLQAEFDDPSINRGDLERWLKNGTFTWMVRALEGTVDSDSKGADITPKKKSTKRPAQGPAGSAYQPRSKARSRIVYSSEASSKTVIPLSPSPNLESVATNDGEFDVRIGEENRVPTVLQNLQVGNDAQVDDVLQITTEFDNVNPSLIVEVVLGEDGQVENVELGASQDINPPPVEQQPQGQLRPDRFDVDELQYLAQFESFLSQQQQQNPAEPVVWEFYQNVRNHIRGLLGCMDRMHARGYVHGNMDIFQQMITALSRYSMYFLHPHVNQYQQREDGNAN